MRVSTPGGGRTGISILALCLLAAPFASASEGDGTLEKMIVASGRVALDLDLQQVREANTPAGRQAVSRLRFDAEKDAFLTFMVFNGEMRGPLPGSMRLHPREDAALPTTSLNASRENLVVENAAWGAPYDMVVRDGTTGFLFFNVEGHTFDYDAKGRALAVTGGRLLISTEFADALGRKSAAGAVAGALKIEATLRPVEIAQIIGGQVREDVLPGIDASLGGVPGPDVIVGDLNGLAQFGASGTQVGLAVGTDSCNNGQVNLNWFQLPSNDHPVIPQNLYRLSGGPTNDRRMEQIGQSSVKHAFTALTENLCGFGCNGVGGTQLGSGCSDPYVASLNATPNLGSRAWINPFTGFFPSGTNVANSHIGHTHPAGGALHRILVEAANLNTTLNPGATYYAEAQYVTPHEYAWCQSNVGQCNMYNNVSYRRYNVSGTTSFSFSPAASTVRMQPAVSAWPGATLVQVEPQPGVDGVAYIAYKVTNPSAGVWHYEYALYNQNLDRAIQALGIPKPAGVNISNVGFHAPPQHAGWPADGTVGNTGYSSAPWTQTEASGVVTWSSQTMAQNPNANAVRWGSMYNIWFDSDRPPTSGAATLTFFKTRARVKVTVQVPSAP